MMMKWMMMIMTMILMIMKWMMMQVNPLAVDSGSKSQIDKDLTGFMNTFGRRPHNPVLIISYETFRLHCAVLHTSEVTIILYPVY